MFPSLYGVVSQGAAAAGWWVVAGKTCVAAYQPIGAASLAASYTNLANPGTYDAAPGVAPTWASGTGWAFNGSTQYLTLGVISWTETWSLIVRFADSGNNRDCLGGFDSALAKYVLVKPTFTDFTTHAYYNGGKQNSVAGLQATGVMAICGASCYLNGVADGTISALPSWTLDRALYVGSRQYSNAPNTYWQGKVQAFAIYSDTLTAPQVATLSAAMAALT